MMSEANQAEQQKTIQSVFAQAPPYQAMHPYPRNDQLQNDFKSAVSSLLKLESKIDTLYDEKHELERNGMELSHCKEMIQTALKSLLAEKEIAESLVEARERRLEEEKQRHVRFQQMSIHDYFELSNSGNFANKKFAKACMEHLTKTFSTIHVPLYQIMLKLQLQKDNQENNDKDHKNKEHKKE